jgi:hypothetical protein
MGILRRHPAFRALFVARCVSYAGDALSMVALMLHVAATTGQALAVAALLLAGDFVPSLLAPLAGALGAVGLGLTAGYALLTKARMPLTVLLIVGFAVSSAGNLLTGVAARVVPGALWAAGAVFAMQAGRGLGIAAIDVASNTLLQKLVPDAMLGRVFANLYGAVGIAAALSYVGGGLLLGADHADRRRRPRRVGCWGHRARARPACLIRSSTDALLASPLANG